MLEKLGEGWRKLYEFRESSRTSMENVGQCMDMNKVEKVRERLRKFYEFRESSRTSMEHAGKYRRRYDKYREGSRTVEKVISI